MRRIDKIKENIAKATPKELVAIIRTWDCSECPIFNECFDSKNKDCDELLAKWLESEDNLSQDDSEATVCDSETVINSDTQIYETSSVLKHTANESLKSLTIDKKYELIEDDTIEVDDITLYRIRALKDFGSIKTGELGGYVENEANLSQTGNCWVSGNAKVYGNAKISDNATVCDSVDVWGNAQVCDDATIRNFAYVGGNARVCDKAQVAGNAHVFGNAQIRNNAKVYGKANVFGNVTILHNAEVYGNAWLDEDAKISDFAKVHEKAIVRGHAQVYGNVIVGGNACITDEMKIGGDIIVSSTNNKST